MAPLALSRNASCLYLVAALFPLAALVAFAASRPAPAVMPPLG